MNSLINLGEARLVCKSDIWWARLIGSFMPSFMKRWWTTYRWPFCTPVISFPVGVDPAEHQSIIEHELVHVRQLTSWPLLWFYLLYLVFPLPVLFSGRWFVEREAFLHDIRNRRCTTGQAADTLWASYGWCWPRQWMLRWFEERRV